MSKAEQITVTMSREHALAVIHGLEMYQRVSMGAWRYVADYAAGEHGLLCDEANLAETLRKALTPDMHPNAHKGIGGASQRAKLACEVQATMRQVIALKEGGGGVWRYDPLSYSGEPMPKAEVTPATGGEK